jgi:hypothetical protein
MDYDSDIYACDGHDNNGDTIYQGLGCEDDKWIDLADDKIQWPVVSNAETGVSYKHGMCLIVEYLSATWEISYM